MNAQRVMNLLPGFGDWEPRGKRIQPVERNLLAEFGRKWCPDCRSAKRLEEFQKHAATVDGLQFICAACSAERNRKSSLTNRRRAQYMRSRADRRLRKQGIEPTDTNLLSVAEIEAVLDVGRCERTGIPFDLSPPGADYKNHPFAPSLDRIDQSNRMYPRKNVQVVLYCVNTAKSSGTDDELVKLAQSALQHRDGHKEPAAPLDAVPERFKGWKPKGIRITPAEQEGLAAAGCKWCPSCRLVHPLDMFTRTARAKDGLREICRCCQSLRGAGYTKANPLLTPEQVQDLALRFRAGVCEATGTRLAFPQGEGVIGCLRSPSLEHIDPKAGDTFDNLMVTSTHYNVAKSDYKPHDVDLMLHAAILGHIYSHPEPEVVTMNAASVHEADIENALQGLLGCNTSIINIDNEVTN